MSSLLRKSKNGRCKTPFLWCKTLLYNNWCVFETQKNKFFKIKIALVFFEFSTHKRLLYASSLSSSSWSTVFFAGAFPRICGVVLVLFLREGDPRLLVEETSSSSSSDCSISCKVEKLGLRWSFMSRELRLEKDTEFSSSVLFCADYFNTREETNGFNQQQTLLTTMYFEWLTLSHQK